MSDHRPEARGSAEPDAGRVSVHDVPAAALRLGYQTGSTCLLHPGERDRDGLRGDVERLSATIPAAAGALEEFLVAPEAWSEGAYLETLELAPACPPYLGAHLFDEPDSCRGLARSDRNPYMVELRGVYRHFGWELDGGELPDYLPLVADFLRLTVRARLPRDLSIRRYLVQELVRPGIGPLRRALEERESPYAGPVRALEVVVERDVARRPGVAPWSPPEEEKEPRPRCGRRLAGVGTGRVPLDGGGTDRSGAQTAEAGGRRT